jgi:hypothetical protein
MEREWLTRHEEDYRGAWVALQGSELVASGTSLKEVLDIARARGYDLPLVHHIPLEPELPFGGW